MLVPSVSKISKISISRFLIFDSKKMFFSAYKISKICHHCYYKFKTLLELFLLLLPVFKIRKILLLTSKIKKILISAFKITKIYLIFRYVDLKMLLSTRISVFLSQTTRKYRFCF